jgi:hypothetical protein
MVKTFSRHVARHVKHPTDPEKKVTGIKVYRVVHNILSPKQVAEGVSPEAEWLYYPYYQGEYDADGNLKDPKDPLLFWLIPIVKDPIADRRKPLFARIGAREGDEDTVANFLEKHVKLETAFQSTIRDVRGDE